MNAELVTRVRARLIGSPPAGPLHEHISLLVREEAPLLGV